AARPCRGRGLSGPAAIVALCTPATAELDVGAGEPVDCLSVAPVNETPTKPGRAGTGLGYLEYAAAHATRPWFVTGGVTPGTVPAMVAAGARRFVVVRWLTEADDPARAARRLADAIDAAVGEA